VSPISSTFAAVPVIVVEVPSKNVLVVEASFAAILDAVAALPVHEPEEPLTFPVTLPVNGPLKPLVAVTVPANVVLPVL